MFEQRWHTQRTMSKKIRTAELEEEVRFEQVRLIHAQGPTLVLGATLCGSLVTFFMWDTLPRHLLLIWLAVMCVVAALRLFEMRSYSLASDETRKSGNWGLSLWIGTLVSGLIWGCWPLLFYQHSSTEYLLLISTVFAGMVAVSAASGSLYYPSFVSFSVPLIIPLSIAHFFSDNELLRITGFLLLVFGFVNAFLAARGNSYSKELIRARFSNQLLMDRLEHEKLIAERAVIAKSRFIAAASHDLRQPLHAMGLFLDALRKRETNPRQMEIINDLTESSEALNGLFNGILDVSRLDAEIIDFNPSHFYAGSLLDHLQKEFAAQAKEKEISLVIEYCDAVLFCDQILLERVIRNLLSNAIQYTSSGGVRLRCITADNRVLIRVEDTGMGIPEDHRDEVFSEYYQLSNPERDRAKGLGLGLAIVRRLCELMGLPMHMETEVGKGTVFEISIPRGEVASLPVPAVRDERSVTSSGQLVLVIDDEKQVLESMALTLENWGFESILADSAKSAIKKIAILGRHPDIVISDYRLRNNENGLDAVAAVRESINYWVPAIIVSGDTTPERLKEVGESDLELLHKPVVPDLLHTTLDRLLIATTQITQQRSDKVTDVTPA